MENLIAEIKIEVGLSATGGRNVSVKCTGFQQELIGALILGAIQSPILNDALQAYIKFKDHPITENLRGDFKARNS